jgi:hypothetical protein
MMASGMISREASSEGYGELSFAVLKQAVVEFVGGDEQVSQSSRRVSDD